MATVHRNRRIERAGVNALRTLLDDHGHLVQEIAGSADHGEDCFVMLTRGGKKTGYACTVQVKAGRKYKRARGYAIDVGHHAADWRASKLPVVGVVHDVDEQRLFWINLTQQLNWVDTAPGWIAVPRENELHAGTIGAFCAHIEEFTDAPAAGRPPSPRVSAPPAPPVFRAPKQVWQHATGAPGTRQPQVAQGCVVVRQGYRLRVLDAVSGAVCWSGTTAFDRTSPAGDDAVFVSVGAGRLRALSLREGRPRWERRLRVRDDLAGYGAQMLYAPTEQGEIFAVDSRTGDVVWAASKLAAATSGAWPTSASPVPPPPPTPP
ncbi:DUF4365 domain-containing protein [Streptomyces sp. NPDC005438]|uniref:DUF4365 domain-containing protein n=1 Tax=Streptomyces sp. NPDC005438 TaxID=3156880 RepID=UPI0033BF3C80